MNILQNTSKTPSPVFSLATIYLYPQQMTIMVNRCKMEHHTFQLISYAQPLFCDWKTIKQTAFNFQVPQYYSRLLTTFPKLSNSLRPLHLVCFPCLQITSNATISFMMTSAKKVLSLQ